MSIVLLIIIFSEWIILQRILGASNMDILKSPLNLAVVLVSIILIFNSKKVILKLKASGCLKVIYAAEAFAIIALFLFIYFNI